jgi:OOP family OmpA-OmpF porin
LKKIIFTLIVLLTQLSFANSYKYEITPVAGYTFNDSYIPLSDYPIYGLEVQFNQNNAFFYPELSFYYERGEYDYQNSDEAYLYTKKRDIYTIALRGVHEFQRNDSFLPFFKIGGSNRTLVGDDDELCHSAFLDLGLGSKIYLTESVALKLESLYMINYNNDRVNQHVSLLAGLTFSFGGHEYKAPKRKVRKKRVYIKPRRVRVAPVDNDIDKDGVANSIDDCPNTPIGVVVNKFGCQIIEDYEPIEEAPVVIRKEAPTQLCLDTIYKKIANLDIKFKYKSYHLTEKSKNDLTILSKFLRKNRDYNLKIIGYTDNIASKHYNQVLSEKRANSIKNLMIERGIDARRLTALGLGEKYPIASNSTASGRAKNRRTEFILIKR